MKLDADKLRAEAAAHRERLQSPLWADDGGRRDDSWTTKLAQEAHPSAKRRDEEAPRERIDKQQPADLHSILSAHDESPPAHPRKRGAEPEPMLDEILRRQDAIGRAVETLTAAQSHRPVGGGDTPGWLARAAGDPHTYDAPDAARKGVCVRVLPGTYAQLQQIQRKMGLRTTAGAWEFLLRLGFAAVERGAAQ
jgi:hypothetical protein